MIDRTAREDAARALYDACFPTQAAVLSWDDPQNGIDRDWYRSLVDVVLEKVGETHFFLENK